MIEVRLAEFLPARKADQQGHTSSELEKTKVSRPDMWLVVVVVLRKTELELE